MHLAKNVLLAVMAGVLFGKATVGFEESYQEIVEGELHPVAVRVVVFPDTVMLDGVAIGLVGAAVELTVIVPVAITVPQPPVKVTV